LTSGRLLQAILFGGFLSRLVYWASRSSRPRCRAVTRPRRRWTPPRRGSCSPGSPARLRCARPTRRSCAKPGACNTTPRPAAHTGADPFAGEVWQVALLDLQPRSLAALAGHPGCHRLQPHRAGLAPRDRHPPRALHPAPRGSGCGKRCEPARPPRPRWPAGVAWPAGRQRESTGPPGRAEHAQAGVQLADHRIRECLAELVFVGVVPGRTGRAADCGARQSTGRRRLAAARGSRRRPG
jgi:hypothetical protein